MIGPLRGAWQYRHFIMTSVRNEFVTRFARSRIGGAWAIIHPLSMVLIYALILSAVLSAKLPGIDSRFAYAIYLTAGMLAWSLFSELLNRCMGVFIENGDLIKKMKFPKITLPIISLGASLVNNLILFVIVLLVFGMLGHFSPMALVWIPVLTCICALFSLGLGLTLGVLNVFMRDVGQIMPIFLQFLFWFTPVVYPEGIVPEALRGWLNLNPLYHLVSAYHDVLVYGEMPSLLGLSVVTSLGVALLTLGVVLFKKSVHEMVDAL